MRTPCLLIGIYMVFLASLTVAAQADTPTPGIQPNLKPNIKSDTRADMRSDHKAFARQPSRMVQKAMAEKQEALKKAKTQ